MEYRILGKDLKVSAIGLGCMSMSHAYGKPADKKEITKLLEKSIDIGYTFFDTAESYGTDDNPHDNEEFLGKALKPYRNKIVIATKFGISFDESSNVIPKPLITNSNPKVIKKSVEGSLKRLQTDHIDLYYQHRFDNKVPIEEVAETMKELIKEGKITHWGLSEATEENIRKANTICPVTAIQNRYNMMYRNYKNLFPVLEELNIGFVPFSPLANGLLSACYSKDDVFTQKGDYRASMPQFQAAAYEQNKDLLSLIRNLAISKGCTPAQISLAWILCKKDWLVPIPGTRNINRLEENANSVNIKLTEQEVSSIDITLDNMKMSDVFRGTRIVK